MTKPGDSQTKKTLHELAKEFPEKTYRELEKYRDADRQEEAQQIFTQQENEELKADQGKEIDYHRYWKKRAEEAEGELSILKGIETNRVKEAQARSNQLQDELDRVSKEKNDLYNRIAELIEANEKEVKNLKWIKDHDYIFLIDENKKLHAEIKKIKEGALDEARKAGL